MPKVLMADDDDRLREFVADWMEHENFTVDLAADGDECKQYLLSSQYDVLIIDWDMPKINGVELCRWFRSKGGTTPILMLTGKDHIEDKETGFGAGVDDYFTKPFEVRELAIRVRALMRRAHVAVSRIMTIGPLVIDPEAYSVSINNEPVKLTSTEFSVLEFLGRHPNQVFSTAALLTRVWSGTTEVSPDAVRVCIGRLRAKFETLGQASLIENLHGIGYRLNSK
jgi:DNA-binding response OmpR family regulator